MITLYIATMICAIMVVLMVRRPLLALLLYGMTATYADGFGVSEWLGTVEFFRPSMNMLFIMLFARAVARLTGKIPIPSRTRMYALTCLTAVAWCLLAVAIRDSSPYVIAANLPYLALPYTIIWVAYAEASSSRHILSAFVIAQTALSVAVLLMPSLEFLQGSSYNVPASRNLDNSGDVNLTLPDTTTVKGLAGDHYAQFHNPNLLGFYGAAAIAVGLYVASRPPLRYRIGGIMIVLAGSFMWLNSLTRGPMLGLLIMLTAAWLFRRDSRWSWAKTIMRAITAFTVAIIVSSLAQSNGVLGYLIPQEDNISVTGRLPGYAEAWRLIQENPLFGRPAEYQWDAMNRPHFIGLLFGAEYGALPGALITGLIFVTGGLVAVRAILDSRLAAHSAMTAMIFGIMAGVAATDNYAGPVLFGVILGHLFIVGGLEQVLPPYTNHRKRSAFSSGSTRGIRVRGATS